MSKKREKWCAWCKNNFCSMSGIFVVCGHIDGYKGAIDCPHYKKMKKIPDCILCGEKAFVNYQDNSMPKKLPFCPECLKQKLKDKKEPNTYREIHENAEVK